MLLENLGTFLPCMGLLVPFVRLARVAKVDAGIGEKSEHARKLRIDSGRAYECVSLVDLVGRIGSCDRQYFYREPKVRFERVLCKVNWQHRHGLFPNGRKGDVPHAAFGWPIVS